MEMVLRVTENEKGGTSSYSHQWSTCAAKLRPCMKDLTFVGCLSCTTKGRIKRMDSDPKKRHYVTAYLAHSSDGRVYFCSDPRFCFPNPKCVEERSCTAFDVKKNTKLNKLVSAYCHQTHLSQDRVSVLSKHGDDITKYGEATIEEILPFLPWLRD